MHVYLTLFACLMNLIIAAPSLEAVSVGCTDNNDCPDYSACDQAVCINPCAQNDPCAALATCKVINHAPVCTCPDGFIGSPTTQCRPRKYIC